MGIEIERKFLVKNDAWRQQVTRTSIIAQAYLNKDFQFSVRVRLQTLKDSLDQQLLFTSQDENLLEANLNVKTCEIGMSRSEYTYVIPLQEAQEIFAKSPWQILKKRHYVEHAGLLWEIDEFLGENKGLVVAEVELESEKQNIPQPEWCGFEVTQDARYYNHSLSFRPYMNWVTHLEINSQEQKLYAFNSNNQCIQQYTISTAKNGLGEIKDSYCTPRGLHQVRAKIGSGLTSGAVLVGRRASGEIFSKVMASQAPKRDWILSRILWLSGLEKGKNRLGNVDTMQRYIYIHGAPDTENEPLGEAHSHGCIRMRNHDIIELFECVFVGTSVMIN